jgi:hypothetical protein
MEWKATESTWKQPEVGNWSAICIRVIDLGTQDGEFQGKPKSSRQCRIVWELTDQFDDNRKPLIIQRTYTSSLGEKANLRKDLESWRGRPFTSAELTGFDVKNILGKPCLLNLIKKQRTYGESVEIAAVSALPKSMPAPAAPVNEMYIYSIEEHDPVIWDKLSARVQERINGSHERRNSAPPVTPVATTTTVVTDDDIPF